MNSTLDPISILFLIRTGDLDNGLKKQGENTIGSSLTSLFIVWFDELCPFPVRIQFVTAVQEDLFGKKSSLDSLYDLHHPQTGLISGLLESVFFLHLFLHQGSTSFPDLTGVSEITYMFL